MSEDEAFADLIRRVRAGDQQAASELVKHYEPKIRQTARRRLTDPKLRRLFDSADVCQSVLGAFFDGVEAGQFELDNPEQLIKLLSTMARNKVTSYARQQRAARRDPGRVPKGRQQELLGIDHGPSPGDVVAAQDLLLEFRKRLSAEERRIADQRAMGRSWTEIAAEIGGSADGLRMQLTRAIARVSRQLRIEE
jgi:RNA polymerase sigma-70 factor (ECF subfamily)